MRLGHLSLTLCARLSSLLKESVNIFDNNHKIASPSSFKDAERACIIYYYLQTHNY